ncbi:MAG: hypothetical protein IH621_01400 [Krumholzibacteria bacterium]|nr:hypothetical protein [Candidatus Krumholzibacteria bacterium]
MRSVICIVISLISCGVVAPGACGDLDELVSTGIGLGDAESVFVCKVLDVYTAEVMRPNGLMKSMARVNIEPIEILKACCGTLDVAYSLNAFSRDKSGSWLVGNMADAPWLKVGDTVLLVTEYFEDYIDSEGRSGVHRISQARYIFDKQVTGESMLYFCDAKVPTEWGDGMENLPSRDLYTAIERTFRETGISVQNIAKAVGAAGGAAR